MPKQLHGVLPIVHTPFLDDDQIDWATLQREVDWAFAQGIDGLGTGMVSELLKLTADERKLLAKRLVEFTAGRGPVFMGVGAESTVQAVAHARAAADAGCDAVMATPPMTGKANEAQLTAYFRALADAMSLPVIVQDASGYVGQAIPLRVYRELLDCYGPEKILFKPEASPVGPLLSAVRDLGTHPLTPNPSPARGEGSQAPSPQPSPRGRGSQIRIFEGSGGIFLIDSFRRGIAGTMPGMEMVDGIVALWQALEASDEALAYRLSSPIGAIVALQLQAGLDGFLAIEKHLLVRRGIFPSARRRGPYAWELDSETAAEVERLFDQLQTVLAESSAAADE